MPSQKIAVLVVEDEVLVRMDIAQELADHGLDVIEAPNSTEALMILNEKSIDVVFTDVDMPGGVDGLELANIVRKRFDGVRILITSGHRNVNVGGLPQQTKFIPKPYTSQHVLSTILELASATE